MLVMSSASHRAGYQVQVTERANAKPGMLPVMKRFWNGIQVYDLLIEGSTFLRSVT